MHQRSLDCTFDISLLQGEWYRTQCIILHGQPVEIRPVILSAAKDLARCAQDDSQDPSPVRSWEAHLQMSKEVKGRLPGLMTKYISCGAPAWFPFLLRRNLA